MFHVFHTVKKYATIGFVLPYRNFFKVSNRFGVSQNLTNSQAETEGENFFLT